MLPTFLIVGAQKAGTTTLFHYLSQHPQVQAPVRKEIHYFDGGLNPRYDNYSKGPSWYRAHFPVEPSSTSGLHTFEASPSYLFNPLAPARIHRLIPSVKIVVLLRDPVERAISHYFHEVRKGRESLDIQSALQIEESRLADAVAQRNFKATDYITKSYKNRGHYAEQLGRYLGLFTSSQILVLDSERLFSQPEAILRETVSFLELTADFRTVDLQPKNIGDNRGTVSDEIYEQLASYFRPHNENLAKLTGRRFSWHHDF